MDNEGVGRCEEEDGCGCCCGEFHGLFIGLWMCVCLHCVMECDV